MNEAQTELLNDYKEECERNFDLAQYLDSMNPTLVGAFRGNPSARIRRQLIAAGLIDASFQAERYPEQ